MSEKSIRISTVDEFRGFAIASMILVNFLAQYKAPSIFHHSEITGLTFTDIVAPLFVFIIGLMYRKSYLRRVSLDGRAKTWTHFIKRYSLLGVIGFIITLVLEGHIRFEWGVLQTIGLAGIITLPFIESNYFIRASTSLIALGIYQTLLLSNYKDVILSTSHGGPIAAISWSSIILLSSVAYDLIDFEKIKHSIRKLILFGFPLLAVGITFSKFIPISKNQVNISYITVSIAISVLFLAAFMVTNNFLCISIPTFKTLGQNALLIYIIHSFLVEASHFILPEASPTILVIAGLCITYSILCIFAILLNKKNIILKL